MTGWLLSISAGAIAILLLENLTQGGAMKQTARFALGIVFMLILLEPIIDFLVRV